MAAGIAMRRVLALATLLLAAGCPDDPATTVDAGLQPDPDAGRVTLEWPNALERSPEGRGLPPELWPPGSR